MTDEEVVVPKIKRIKKENRQIRIPVLNILFVLFCSFFLIIASFVQLNITHFIMPHDLFSGKALKFNDFLYTYSIIPQIPAVLFVTGFLGRRPALTSIILYIIIGLFLLPVFALGGGPKYIMEFGFGYIAAYIPAAFFAGSILESGYTLKNIAKATLVAVVTIHFIGIIYMLFIAALKQEGWEFIKGWIVSQSLLKIAYDYVLSFVALYIAKYANKYLKFLMN